MDSKTAKAVDKALLELEKAYAKFKLAAADVKATIKRHYAKPPRSKKNVQ